MSFDHDLIVLGGGPAGEKGAAQAAYFGRRVAVVERAGRPGGAAVHTGTLPSKTLRETALFLSGYRQRDLYGVTVAVDPELAVDTLIARKDAIRGLESDRMLSNLRRHGVEMLRGAGRLVGPHTVEVSSQDGLRRISAEAILVSTGSSPHRPPEIPFDEPGIDDSDTILGIERLPESLTVIGGGIIGCEYASIFAAMGVSIRLADPRADLLPFLDREICGRLVDGMRALGIEFHLGEALAGVGRCDAGIASTLASGRRLESERLLVTSGRSGNTAGLGLKELGIEIDRRGYVVVDEEYRTAVPSVFAAGDVIGFPGLASTSIEQARVAVCHAFGFAYKQEVSHLLPYGVYTIPEVSCAGVTEEAAAEAGVEVVVGRASYRDNARGQIIGDAEGMTKLLFDRADRELIGCHCIGERAAELVHVGEAVMLLGGTVDTLIEMVFNYPTLGETYKYAAYDALGSWADTP